MSRSVVSLRSFIKMDSQVARNNKWGPPRRPEHRWLQQQTLVGEMSMSLPLTQQSRDLAGQQGAWLRTQGGVLMSPLKPWPPGLPAIGLGAVISWIALGSLQGLFCPLLGTLPTRPFPKAIGGDSRRGLRVQRDPECLIRERTNCRQALLPPIQPLDLLSCEAQLWSQGHFSPRGPLLGVRGGLALRRLRRICHPTPPRRTSHLPHQRTAGNQKNQVQESARGDASSGPPPSATFPLALKSQPPEPWRLPGLDNYFLISSIHIHLQPSLDTGV